MIPISYENKVGSVGRTGRHTVRVKGLDVVSCQVSGTGDLSEAVL